MLETSMFWDSLFWLGLNLLTIVVLAFFSMEEMAFVSFNKIRLQLYLNEGNKRAKWIDSLLSRPSRLFGTTLIGVNVSMMLGSEFAREFHSHLGLDPDWAPLSQVLLVIIFGELAPQFAARRYPEHVALLGAPLLYYMSLVMTPFIWLLGILSKVANFLLGGKESHHDLFLTLDELQRILEEKDEEHQPGKSEDLDTIVSNIFRLRGLSADKVMIPMNDLFSLPGSTTVASLRKQLKEPKPWIPLYEPEQERITGILILRDLIRVGDTKRLQGYSSSPWFITENMPILKVLKQFRSNKAVCACVIDNKGRALGILGLDTILNEIFGKLSVAKSSRVVVDVTVSGDMTLKAFNKEFKVQIHETGCETLAELFLKKFDNHPEVGQTLHYPPLELTVKEKSLLEIKKIVIKTKQ